ncbi:MAG: undecaprenyl-diphosphatase [Actinobacteria bacterium]|nr:undecaprenyl-diphosphatase [Actinomycetota bacterium]
MFESIVLGLIQGLTEFLPISSSAHQRIVGEFFSNAQDPGARFTAITQIGTELAVLIFFRNDIKNIVLAWFNQAVLRKNLTSDQKPLARMGWLIIVGSLPIVFLGYLGKDIITNDFRSLWLISSSLIVFGVILGLADHYGKKEKGLSELNVKHGIQLKDAFGSGASNVYTLPQTFIATAIAFVVGYAVIAWLLKFVTTKSFMPFIIYRIALGTTVLVLLSAGIINP